MPPALSVSRQLNSFSALEQRYLRNLGLEDKNNDGLITKGRGEGYEQFQTKYGNADTGFYINGITQSADNGHLETNEIINHYYINIRFKPEFAAETAAIDGEVEAYLYAESVPLVWLDDGTAMRAVNRVLGVGWQNRTLLAEENYKKVLNALNDGSPIRGLTSQPYETGYFQLPEFVNRKSGYCFEAAQFGFWFFSQLKISSAVLETALTPSLIHGIIKLNDSDKIIDYFRTSERFNLPLNQWAIINPVQSIGEYYIGEARSRESQGDAEKSVIFNKYNISNMAYLLDIYADNPNRNHEEIIALGEFILENIDIPQMMNSTDKKIETLKSNFAYILSTLIKSSSSTKHRQMFNRAESLLNQYYSHDPGLEPLLDYYRF